MKSLVCGYKVTEIIRMVPHLSASFLEDFDELPANFDELALALTRAYARVRIKTLHSLHLKEGDSE